MEEKPHEFAMRPAKYLGETSKMADRTTKEKKEGWRYAREERQEWRERHRKKKGRGGGKGKNAIEPNLKRGSVQHNKRSVEGGESNRNT